MNVAMPAQRMIGELRDVGIGRVLSGRVHESDGAREASVYVLHRNTEGLAIFGVKDDAALLAIG